MVRVILLNFFLLLFLQSHGQLSDFPHVNFPKADSIASAHAKADITDLYTLSLKLTKDLDNDVEKFRAIYKWVTDNIENDYDLFFKNKNMRAKLKDPEALAKWNADMHQLVFKKLRKNKSTVCTGYAYLLRELATPAGIRCEIVNGYGRNASANISGEAVANHSWNAVQLQGKWYLCDATWSSGAIDLERKAFIKNCDNTYFLPDPALFIRNHYPQDTAWALLTHKPSLNDFLNRPLIYVRALTIGIHTFSPETFDVSATAGEPVSFRFQTSNRLSVETATLQVIRSGRTTEFTVPVVVSDDYWHAFTHTFRSPGIHTVQVKLGDKYVFCYRVTVSR